MPLVTESYIGQGIVYVGGRDVGNASGVQIDIEQETKELPNYRGGGGNFAEVTKVKSVKLKMTLNEFSNDNLALALRGTVSVEPSVQVTDEAITAKLDGLARTAKMIDTTQTVVVKNTGGTVTYVNGTDYALSAAGIRALSGGQITDAAALKVSYKSVAGSALEALTESGIEVPVVIDGINDATGKPWVLEFYKWKPSPASGLGVLTDDFGSFELEGGVLADATKVGVAKSKFFRRIAA